MLHYRWHFKVLQELKHQKLKSIHDVDEGFRQVVELSVVIAFGA
jgi:hypothetical protein